MAETLTYVGELTVLTCWCGTRHAVPAEMRNHQVRKHENGEDAPGIYCPHGHTHVPSGKTTVEKLREQLAFQRDFSANVIAERDQLEASARAYKGAATRARKRAKAGVCPCCNRTVQQLARHMKTKHPDFDPEGSKHGSE